MPKTIKKRSVLVSRTFKHTILKHAILKKTGAVTVIIFIPMMKEFLLAYDKIFVLNVMSNCNN